MIRTVSELLTALKDKELELLSTAPDPGHPQMIGDMYEGLTKELLGRAVFDGLDLRIVDGKIQGKTGQLSKQIDCMIVEGEGKRLPHTDHFIYPANQVVATIEVKKNLYANDLASAHDVMRSVVGLADAGDASLRLFRDAYRQILRQELPKRRERITLPFVDEMVYYALLLNALCPLRIILGYFGFATERTLRQAFIRLVQRSIPTSGGSPVTGFGPGALPNLVLCRDIAIAKIDGMPLSSPMANDTWSLMASVKGRSIELLLELLWTRLSYRHGLGSELFGEDLEVEVMNPLLQATPVTAGETRGWAYNTVAMDRNDLDANPGTAPWEPVELTQHQWAFFRILGEDGEIALDNPALRSYLDSHDIHLDTFIQSIESTGLVYMDSEKTFRYLTDECATVILPDGRAIGADNATGRLERWVAKFMKEWRERAR
ncbi:MAG: hypothetical protein KAY24_10140 [Candidatus Eisenbacteria sp.]|nr:hypothetical protein [Candidatus Eisenbacteria bacterium]